VRARFGSVIVSPGVGAEPSGFNQNFWFWGQLLKKSRLPLIVVAVSGLSANPLAA
jgi:hypothetical protein